MLRGSYIQGIVTTKTHHEAGTHWHVALDNDQTASLPTQKLKRLLLPEGDQLLWATTALREPSILKLFWVRKQYGPRWYLRPNHWPRHRHTHPRSNLARRMPRQRHIRLQPR
jgi:hypothetical protein